MKSNLLRPVLIASIAASLSACVVAPPSQPIGYRMTSSELPTYVNGQYIGIQPSNYVPPATPAAAAPTTTANTTVHQAQAVPPAPPAPTYVQSTTPSVVYMQAPQPAPVYAYPPSYYPYSPYPYSPYPYYSPFNPYPWFGGIGIGFRIRVH